MSCNVIRIGVIRLIQCVESIQRKCSVLLCIEDMAEKQILVRAFCDSVFLFHK